MLSGMAKRKKPIETLDPLARAVIAALGGPTKTARIFDIRVPSVMAWLDKGIPDSRLMYLDLAYPEIMRKARKSKNGDVVDRAAASDDTQVTGGTPANKPKPKGGKNARKTKQARMAA